MYSAISFFPLVLPLILSLPVQALSSFTGLLTVEAPSEQRSIVWPHNFTEGNGQMSYNGKGTVFKLGYGKTTRKYDRFDMALIGEDTAGKLTSFKYVVVSISISWPGLGLTRLLNIVSIRIDRRKRRESGQCHCYAPQSWSFC